MVIGLGLFVVGMVAGRSKFVPFFGPTGPFITWDADLTARTAVRVARAAAFLSGVGLVGVLWALRRGWAGVSPRVLMLGGAVAAAVLAVVPPAGSIDILNYAIYGRIADLGFDPYSMTPDQLRAAHDPVGLLGPGSWGDQPTVYGPVATAVQTAAARLGGASMGWILFWLKVFNAAAFLATAMMLDRIAGAERRVRIRAAVLWTANPLMLFWMVGSGHADVLAVTLFIGAVCVLWFGLRQSWPGVWLGLGAGVLAGGAVLVKVTFAVPLIGLGIACLKRPAVVAWGAGGAAVTAGIAYLGIGRTAVSSLTERMAHAGDLFLPVPSVLLDRPLLYTATMAAAMGAVAVLVWWRVRDESPALPRGTLDLRPVAACAIACVVVSPVQYPWYNAAFIPVLALLGATRFDEAIVLRATVLSCILLPGIGTSRLQLDGVAVAAPFFLVALMALALVPTRRIRLPETFEPDRTKSTAQMR
ncbi:carotene biosynthesis associated membrane protein [Mycobacterium tuberculosis]|nr:carotene biosynthesis associated membrane protein [Mycobacterium tuberculosis]